MKGVSYYVTVINPLGNSKTSGPFSMKQVRYIKRGVKAQGLRVIVRRGA